MSRLWWDARLAVRALRRKPVASITALLSLTFGLGANIAVFSLLNAIALRPLPVPHPEQLVKLATTIYDSVNGDQPFTLQMFEALSRYQDVCSYLFVWNDNGITNVQARGRDLTAAIASVSGQYYSAIGIKPLIGRFIREGDIALDHGNSNTVAVISYRAWRDWFNGTPNIIGQVLSVDRQPFTIIGVEPEDYSGLVIDASTDVTVPLFAPGQNTDRDPRMAWLDIYGRLQRGMSIGKARADFKVLWPTILKATVPPGYEGARLSRYVARKIALTSASNGVSSLRLGFLYPLRMLLALVASVPLIACLNLANLSLARATARGHELGVQAALGASRWDLARQPLIESVMLSAASAAVGLLVSSFLTHAAVKSVWTGLTRINLRTSPDYRVLLFTAVIAIVTAILFAIVPLWNVASTSPVTALSSHNRSVNNGPTLLGKALLACQLALSLTLIFAALDLGSYFSHFESIDLGYEGGRVLTALLFPQARRSGAESNAYYQSLVQKLESLPGVASATYSSSAPVNERPYRIPAYAEPTSAPSQVIDEVVGPQFFSVMGMHIVRGRDFSWRDDDSVAGVAIISESLAKRLYGTEDPIGRSIYIRPPAYQQRLRIVGMVTNASLWQVESSHPMAVYRALSQNLDYGVPILDVRTEVNPDAMKSLVNRAIRSLGHDYSLRTLTVDERLDMYLTLQRIMAIAAGLFGGLALLVASIGIYGLTSIQIISRRGELGIRAALGAHGKWLLFTVVRDLLLTLCIGCIWGVALVWMLERVILTHVLVTASAHYTPLLLVGAIFILVSMAIIAALVPTKQVLTADPVAALRGE